jgi:hypothetical protein
VLREVGSGHRVKLAVWAREIGGALIASLALAVRTPEPYRPRMADAYFTELVTEFPAVMITGPPAAGKTTTAAQRVQQIDRLDQPGVAATYRADPDAALRRAEGPSSFTSSKKSERFLRRSSGSSTAMPHRRSSS